MGDSSKVFILGAKWDYGRVRRWIAPYISELQQELVVMIGVRHWFPRRYVAFCYHFRNGDCIQLPSHPAKRMVVHELCHCLHPDWSEANVKVWVKEHCRRAVRD